MIFSFPGLCFDPKSILLVLEIFKVSVLLLHQFAILSRSCCMSLWAMIYSGALVTSTVSSAYKKLISSTSQRPLMYTNNNSGPTTDPCDVPTRIPSVAMFLSLIEL